MPGLVRKLLVIAAVDGLILQPLVQRGQRPAPPVKIDYRSSSIGPALGNIPEAEKGFESFGVVGKLPIYLKQNEALWSWEYMD